MVVVRMAGIKVGRPLSFGSTDTAKKECKCSIFLKKCDAHRLSKVNF